MTKSLKTYGFISAVMTFVFCIVLYPLITHASLDDTAISSLVILFVVALTTAEAACLQRDDLRAARYNLRLRYTLISLVAASIPAALWAFAWRRNGWLFLLIEVVMIVVFVCTAALVNRQRVKGIAKNKLFQ